MATYPADGAGLDCDGSDPSCGVPTDTSIELRFDRFLLPTTAVRQSIRVSSGTAPLVPFTSPEILPDYDVFERVVRYRLPPGVTLEPYAVYTVEAPIAFGDDSFGFRAFDGARLAGEEPLRFVFRTGGTTSAEPAFAPEPRRCEDVLCEVFAGAAAGCALPATTGCATRYCHGDSPAEARMGLVLASAEGVSRTALERVAHGSETGPDTGSVLTASPRFGVAMALIQPERPYDSYLLYKLLLAPEAYEPNEDGEDPCSGTRHRVPLDPELCFAPSVEELARLREWFVRGEPMPSPDLGPSYVHRDEIRALQDFIALGADCQAASSE